MKVLMFSVLYLFLFQFSGLLAQTKNPAVDDSCLVVITRVIDGDTYEFVFDSTSYKVRLVGIDCFEIHKNNRLKKQAKEAGIDIDSAFALGLRALEFVKMKIENKEVLLLKEYSQPNFDIYGRLLREIWVDGYFLSDSLKTLCRKILKREKIYKR